MHKGFLKAGHLPTLFAAFLYFDLSFMVWVLLGPLGVAIAKTLHLDAGHKGLMVATPVLASAALRVVLGLLVDRFGAKRVGIGAQIVVIAGLLAAWMIGIDSFGATLLLGCVLGLAGASFAVALPLASAWYSAEHQGTALGIAGAGNSGTVLAALFAPGLAIAFGWQNVVGLAAIPLVLALGVFVFAAKASPNTPAPKPLSAYFALLKVADCWWFMFFYSVTFGGFVGLASSLTIYFNDVYGLSPVVAGYCTAAVVFVGSLVRPFGGAVADRVGGVRALVVLYTIAACAFATISTGLSTIYLAMPVFLIGMLALGDGQWFGVPACAAALQAGNRRDDRPRRHERRRRRVLSGVQSRLFQTAYRQLRTGVPGVRGTGGDGAGCCQRGAPAVAHDVGPALRRGAGLGGAPT
jgi:NNP family nitrate/nitrite transporter-like MFS transporter